jgi:hypothetical protein
VHAQRGWRLNRGGAGPARVPGRVAAATAADGRHYGQAMPAARMEYIAPWWVVWLHGVPHLDLRLQPVDSIFNPGDESYQEVSPRAPDADLGNPTARAPKVPRHPISLPQAALSTRLLEPRPPSPATPFPLAFVPTIPPGWGLWGS